MRNMKVCDQSIKKTFKLVDDMLELADEGDGKTISRKITHHTIAQMVGSSRETVSRTIRNFTNQGQLTVTPETIEIVDRSGLESAAGLG